MDAFLLAAAGHEIAQIGGGVEFPFKDNGRWGLEAQVMVLPELGAKAQLFIGSNYEDPLYWSAAFGVVQFENPVPKPDHGTEFNFALTLRAGVQMVEDVDWFVEVSHYSNAALIRQKPSYTNPGYDRILTGIAWHF